MFSPLIPATSPTCACARTLAILCLMLSGGQALGAGVNITLDDFGVSLDLTHPTYVTSTGTNHNAEVDLQAGTARALVSASAPASSGLIGRSLVARIDNVELTNTGNVAVVASLQFLSLTLDGSYAFVMGGTGTREASVYVNASLDAILLPAQGGSAQFFGAGIGTSKTWDSDQGFTSGFLEIGEENGGTVTITQNDFGGLQANLLMPAITLERNDVLRISMNIFTGVNASNGMMATNDFFNTARLSLVLPAGISLSSNAGVPLDWVTAVPAPPAVWLLATGLAAVAAFRRGKSTAKTP